MTSLVYGEEETYDVISIGEEETYDVISIWGRRNI